MLIKKSNKMIQLKKDNLDGELTIEGFYYNDDLFFADLYIHVTENDVYIVDTNQGKVYDLPHYSYASHNVLIDCVNDLNDGKVLKCVRLKRLEKEVLNKFYGEGEI